MHVAEVHTIDAVTPYMHVFAHHCGYIGSELYSLGGMKVFSNQQVEKINDTITKLYFRCTNKRWDYMLQLMRKQSV